MELSGASGFLPRSGRLALSRRGSFDSLREARQPSLLRNHAPSKRLRRDRQLLLATAALSGVKLDTAPWTRGGVHPLQALQAALRWTTLAVGAGLGAARCWLQRRLAESRTAAQQQTAAAARVLVQQAAKVQAEASEKRAYLAQLRLGASDPAFMAHLRSLDDPRLDLDHKWGGFGRLAAGKQAISSHLQQLFMRAQESSAALGTTACANAGSLKAFWKSEHTQAVIQEEEKLKRLIYLQMLSAAPG